MIRIPFHALNTFSKLVEKISPHTVAISLLPLGQREAEVRRILAEFDIPVDGKKEWCTWENDQDYTLFCLKWS
jgi:hypothetical protein